MHDCVITAPKQLLVFVSDNFKPFLTCFVLKKKRKKKLSEANLRLQLLFSKHKDTNKTTGLHVIRLLLLDVIVIPESVLIPSNPKVFTHSANMLLMDGIIIKIHFLLRTPGMPLRDPWRSQLPILRSLTDHSPKLVFQYKIPPLCFPVELPWK